MNKKTNILEINGSRYDARTGELLKAAKKTAQPVHDVVAAAKVEPAEAIVSKPETTQKPLTTPKRRPVMDVRRVAAPKSKTHRGEHAHTLMRHVVAKPKTSSLKRHSRVQGANTKPAKQPLAVVLPKLSSEALDAKRLTRSHHIARSKLIKRFADIKTPIYLSHPVALQAAIAATSSAASVAAPVAHQSLDIFEKALQGATSHQQPRLKRAHAKKSRTKGKKLRNTAALSLAVILLGGFVAYQNMAGFTLRYASSKAGFTASLPSYRPAGFSLGRFSYSPGAVSFSFHSNSDQRAFKLHERVSDWDSPTLLNSFVASQVGDAYQTIETDGRTIYLYGQNEATWVNSGVWYQVQTANNLSSSQVIKLATSL